jgi:hypothetical protein
MQLRHSVILFRVVGRCCDALPALLAFGFPGGLVVLVTLLVVVVRAVWTVLILFCSSGSVDAITVICAYCCHRLPRLYAVCCARYARVAALLPLRADGRAYERTLKGVAGRPNV